MIVVEPKATKSENKEQAIPAEITEEASPFLAIAIVVNPSGNALPIDKTNIAKKDCGILNIIPIKFIAETKISQITLFHKTPIKIPNKTSKKKYLGFCLLFSGFQVWNII